MFSLFDRGFLALRIRVEEIQDAREAWRRQPKGLAWRFWGSWRRYSGLRGLTTHGSDRFDPPRHTSSRRANTCRPRLEIAV